MDSLKPMLFTTVKGYTKKQLLKDVIAGIIVAIIALPLSIALALASGVGPEEGLYTAIIAGFIISLLGGSPVQIAGPTAAFATIVAGIVASNGMSGLMLATIMAGIILIVLGLFRLGNLIKFIPYTITTGFTAGIAVTILVGQLKDFFGLTYPEGLKPIETMEKVEAVIHNFGTVNIWAILVGLVCLAILIVWPKISKVIPGSLIAVIVGIFMVMLLKLPVNTIGDLYTVSSAPPTFRLPEFDLAMIGAVIPDAFTIALLAAIESLLSCVVADGMIGSKHRSNAELIAQGVGNVGSAFFGGIPATGAIARTAANIKSGGKTPVAGMVHAVVLLLVLVVLMPLAALIPMPTIAAILFKVAYDMCQWRPFVKLVKEAPVSDIIILVLTFVLTIVFDLVVAIVVGIVLSCVLFMKQMSDNSAVKESAENSAIENIPNGVKLISINGPIFFGTSDKINAIVPTEDMRCMILNFSAVPLIDATGLNSLSALAERCAKTETRFVIANAANQPIRALQRAKFAEKLGNENITDNIAKIVSSIK